MKNLALNRINMISGGHQFKCHCAKVTVNQRIISDVGVVVLGSQDWHDYLLGAPDNNLETIKNIEDYCRYLCNNQKMEMISCTQQ